MSNHEIMTCVMCGYDSHTITGRNGIYFPDTILSFIDEHMKCDNGNANIKIIHEGTGNGFPDKITETGNFLYESSCMGMIARANK